MHILGNPSQSCYVLKKTLGIPSATSQQMWQWRFRILFKTTQICFTVMLWINAWGVYKIFRAGVRGVLSRGAFISYHKKWQKHDNKWVILGSCITVSSIKKKTNKKTVSRKISNIMTEKCFSLVNVNVIFNIIFFDYVKEWSCLCDIFFRYSGGGGGRSFEGGVYWRFLPFRRGIHSRGRLFKALG